MRLAGEAGISIELAARRLGDLDGGVSGPGGDWLTEGRSALPSDPATVEAMV